MNDDWQWRVGQRFPTVAQLIQAAVDRGWWVCMHCGTLETSKIGKCGACGREFYDEPESGEIWAVMAAPPLAIAWPEPVGSDTQQLVELLAKALRGEYPGRPPGVAEGASYHDHHMTTPTGRRGALMIAKLARHRSFPFRVDVFGSKGWQHLASFAGETDAYEYGERYATSGARVWDGDECIAFTDGPRSWRKPEHNRDCDGKPCECAAVPPLGSMHRGTGMR